MWVTYVACKLVLVVFLKPFWSVGLFYQQLFLSTGGEGKGSKKKGLKQKKTKKLHNAKKKRTSEASQVQDSEA
jgi:hypothetical protein